jgi:hypothetical protein
VKDSGAARRKKFGSKAIAITVAVLTVCNITGAMLVAGCVYGEAAARKEFMTANIRAADAWAEVQALSTREATHKAAMNILAAQLASQPDLPQPARQALEQKIAEHRAAVEGTRDTPGIALNKGAMTAVAQKYERDRDASMGLPRVCAMCRKWLSLSPEGEPAPGAPLLRQP